LPGSRAPLPPDDVAVNQYNRHIDVELQHAGILKVFVFEEERNRFEDEDPSPSFLLMPAEVKTQQADSWLLESHKQDFQPQHSAHCHDTMGKLVSGDEEHRQVQW
jgi:hypothetical protein